ncbi:hypothetical protein ACE7GA_01435 [Roseomonas sp. CCTCC AB2023176]|uniref:hypothetical protein n=1 Tax=Roseomonas sp. CCTCC AB2023176 TaxID=3342640 RepID=UPI0035E239B8
MMPQQRYGLVLDHPRVLSAVIERAGTCGGDYHIGLLMPALAEGFRVVILQAGTRMPVRLLDHAERPTAVILAGDPGHDNPPGPVDFPQLARLLRWSASVLIHAAGGQRAHYDAAAYAVRERRRLLIVETCSTREDEWLQLVEAEVDRRGGTMAALPCLMISAKRFGGVHPVQEGRRA